MVDEEVKANLMAILLGTRRLRSFSLYHALLAYYLLSGRFQGNNRPRGLVMHSQYLSCFPQKISCFV